MTVKQQAIHDMRIEDPHIVIYINVSTKEMNEYLIENETEITPLK